jgi:hypothetical protein
MGDDDKDEVASTTVDRGDKGNIEATATTKRVTLPLVTIRRRVMR